MIFICSVWSLCHDWQSWLPVTMQDMMPCGSPTPYQCTQHSNVSIPVMSMMEKIGILCFLAIGSQKVLRNEHVKAWWRMWHCMLFLQFWLLVLFVPWSYAVFVGMLFVRLLGLPGTGVFILKSCDTFFSHPGWFHATNYVHKICNGSEVADMLVQTDFIK